MRFEFGGHVEKPCGHRARQARTHERDASDALVFSGRPATSPTRRSSRRSLAMRSAGNSTCR
jgi:hypothetical protein